jgi:hypothetical protein
LRKRSFRQPHTITVTIARERSWRAAEKSAKETTARDKRSPPATKSERKSRRVTEEEKVAVAGDSGSNGPFVGTAVRTRGYTGTRTYLFSIYL